MQVLEVARENQFSRFGSVCLDETNIHANASRHSALCRPVRWKYQGKPLAA